MKDELRRRIDDCIPSIKKAPANGRTKTANLMRDDDRLLTVDEVADLLRVKPSWIYERVRARKGVKLPHIKMGHYLRFEREAIEEFLQRQRKAYVRRSSNS